MSCAYLHSHQQYALLRGGWGTRLHALSFWPSQRAHTHPVVVTAMKQMTAIHVAPAVPQIAVASASTTRPW